jgi:hypothetical protein
VNAAEYISLALNLLKIVLENAKVQGLAAEVVADIQAAVDKLQSVHGTPVTYEQLESLRIKPTF